MKNTQVILIATRLFSLAAIAFFAYTLHRQSEVLQENQAALTALSGRLSTTISYMDEMALLQEQQEELMKPLAAGTQAPDFALSNQDNELVSLADYKGKKVTLFFSQKGCQYCESFYPVINEFAEKHGEETEILIVQANASVAENKQLKEEKNIIPSVLHTDGTELADFKVFQTPTTIIIDAAGKIQATGSALSMEDLTALYEQG
ncbi:MAG: redoxin domain-containing protein [Bacteroidota bacterium]